MGYQLLIPVTAQIPQLADVLASWQRDNAPLQLHNGDMGWYSLRGLARTAQDLRVWTSSGKICALGLLDGPQLIRLAIDPELAGDHDLAQQLHRDLTSTASRIFVPGQANIEARGASALGQVLASNGWGHGEAWTVLRRSLDNPVLLPELSFRRVGASQAEDWMNVHLQAFRGDDFSAEDLARAVQRWHTMTSSPLYAQGQCLTAYDDERIALAVAAVWSAGPGRPGILEPIAVHPQAQGQGLGTAITLAAAAELRSMGASSALVCTPTENLAAVNTYLAAGFSADAVSHDWSRELTA